MSKAPHRKTGTRRSRGRENKRLIRDKKIFAFLRNLVAIAEHSHAHHREPIEPLSVFFGKEDVPNDWELTPFPVSDQENGRPMPRWEDLSQWMKVMVAVMVCHQWDLLTFNIHLHPDLEREWIAGDERVRAKLGERVRKQFTKAVGKGREFFFMVEGFSKDTGAPTLIHMHGAVTAYDRSEEHELKDAAARAAGHNLRGASQQARAVHRKWFHTLASTYGNYLFHFSRRYDPRLEYRRLVMSRSMTTAARTFWIDITRPHLRP